MWHLCNSHRELPVQNTIQFYQVPATEYLILLLNHLRAKCFQTGLNILTYPNLLICATSVGNWVSSVEFMVANSRIYLHMLSFLQAYFAQAGGILPRGSKDPFIRNRWYLWPDDTMNQGISINCIGIAILMFRLQVNIGYYTRNLVTLSNFRCQAYWPEMSIRIFSWSDPHIENSQGTH